MIGLGSDKNVLQYKLPQRDKDHQSKVIKPVDDKFQKLYFQLYFQSGGAAEEAAGLPGSSFSSHGKRASQLITQLVKMTHIP